MSVKKNSLLLLLSNECFRACECVLCLCKRGSVCYVCVSVGVCAMFV